MIEPHSATWLAVRKLAEEETATALETIASEGISERDADAMRGRITAFKLILKLAEPPREITATNPLY